MRRPAAAGRFYPADERSLRSMLQGCFTGSYGPGPMASPGEGGDMVAALSPHAGLMASGMAAAHVYNAILENGLPEAYVIIGPKHYHRGPEVSLCDEDFLTPIGLCPVHEEIVSALNEDFLVDNAAHREEHSLEMQAVFIRYIDPDPFIVPVLMGDQSPESAGILAESLRRVLRDRNAIIIASGDMSHYVPKAKASRDDKAVIDRMLALDVEGMYGTVYGRDVSACGYGPTAAAILATSPDRAALLRYMDSGDVFDSEEVVGYASVAFYRRHA